MTEDAAKKKKARVELSDLIERYKDATADINRAEVNEEFIRTWVNDFLRIFGWDVQNTNEILQNYALRGQQHERLKEIKSPHRTPDYIMRNGSNIKTFFDARSLDVNVFSDTEAAYQIRCYGWSAQSPCAFVSNFEQLAIFDTRYVPVPKQSAANGALQYRMEDYIDNFDVLFDHLWKESVWNNHLNELYETTGIEGRNRLDNSFMQMLSTFRTALAKNLVDHNPKLSVDDTALNYYIQVIMDRIVFIRVCESKYIEEQEKLRSFLKMPNGFWNTFKNSCYMEFYKRYDGAMFDRNPRFQEIKLDDGIFEEFIEKLYYPCPYKFDVIPVKVIAKIYEEFLGKQITYRNGKINEIIKSEYIQANGAISTPEHIVDMVCKKTLSLDSIRIVKDLLNVKLLDPCCGSGVFLVACYDMLYQALIRILNEDADERKAYPNYFFDDNGVLFLTLDARRAIASNCLHGIDYDDSAIEVAKMSIALKIVDCDTPALLGKVGVFGDAILRDISNNIKLGNTLVDADAELDPHEIEKVKPFNVKNSFKMVFAGKGGFDYIVGNPPYVETKHFISALPAMHKYINKKYSSVEGKADLSVVFIERCLSILNSEGKLGFIVQRRWFKTVYGGSIRDMIDSRRSKLRQMDFKDTGIFRGHITYVSILVMSGSANPDFEYTYVLEDADSIKTLFENSDDKGIYTGFTPQKISNNGKTGQTWAYESFPIKQLQTKLESRIGRLADYPGLRVRDGIQALWKKMYHLANVSFDGDIAVGYNGFGEKVRVESSYVRAVVYNKVFYPFKKITPDAYCIFPYGENGTDRISMGFLKDNAPLLYKYLTNNKEKIQAEVEHRNDNEYWHTFTREHNHTLYDIDKIIIPMTAQDTIATFVSDRGLYMDNANVWFITVDKASSDLMKAIACIINSTVFSVLAKAGANPQSGGYYKFNKQFLNPVAFPCKAVTEGDTRVMRLAVLHDEISKLQEDWIRAIPTKREIISGELEKKWAELDALCVELYQLTDIERSNIEEVGRTVSRIELLGGMK